MLTQSQEVHATLKVMSTTKKLLVAAGVLVVAGVGYYTLSPLFITLHADDPLPEGATSGMPVPGAEGAPEMVVQEAAPMVGAMPVAVKGTLGHPASGTVRVVEAGSQAYVRYENFKTINGPDIFVYLATDPSAKDFVNLGAVKATEGNVNYEIPAGTDLSKYHYVLTWCRQFSILFNSADLLRG